MPALLNIRRFERDGFVEVDAEAGPVGQLCEAIPVVDGLSEKLLRNQRGRLNVRGGMVVGDSNSVRLEPDDAGGQHQQELVQEVPRSALPAEIQPEKGMALQSKSPEGHITNLVVTAVTDESITVDANHPLAGEALSFNIEFVDIK